MVKSVRIDKRVARREAVQVPQGRGPLLDHLDEIEKKCLQTNPTLQDIIGTFGSDGHYLLILFLILPFLQPIPLFGLSTPFGILIAFVALQAYRLKPPWIPHKWRNKVIPSTTVSKIAEGSERIFEKLGFMLRPRWRFFFNGGFRPVNAALLIMNAALLALPLPIPFSNAIPAWMILFQALAHLEEDGLFIILSYVQSLACLIYFALLTKGVVSGAELLGF